VVLQPWASSREHDRDKRDEDERDEIAAPSPRAAGVLKTARRLVGDALSTLRYRPRRPAAAAVPRRQPGLGAPSGGHRGAGRPLQAGDDGPLLFRLLGREPVAFPTEALRPAVAGRSILVTGAAGSIGSELCRQIAALRPRLLVGFDNAESGLFHLDQDLRGCLPGAFVPWIGDVRDARRVDEALARYCFDAVFHAAAYKHVPLMEAYPLELVQTNVLGTWNLARAAANQGVTRFVLISTDKAVHPANVMGLTKRIAEALLAGLAASAQRRTWFAAVRFGNVLGSSGSVVPVFHEQIARGGPLTVTHPEVRRYFMTTQEAAHLVLQVAAMTDRTGTFVLDMGEPVRIDALARKMIRSWGLEPDRDIEIHYVGLRPGEKLDEELIGRGERALPTVHPKIQELRGPAVLPPDVPAWIEELKAAIERRDAAGAIAQMAAVVPDYEPARARAESCKARPAPAAG
jgi:FlaA1/EpsC-like NDP-sugar epimerase